MNKRLTQMYMMIENTFNGNCLTLNDGKKKSGKMMKMMMVMMMMMTTRKFKG